MAVTKEILETMIQKAFDSVSDVEIDPKKARKQVAKDLANAIEAYVKGRTTVVTGTSVTGGAVTGTGIIQ